MSPLLSSGQTLNHPQWQTLKICYVIWFGTQGLSAYRLGPVTRPLLTRQRPAGLGTCERKGFSLSSLLTATGRKSQIWAWQRSVRTVFGAPEPLLRCIQALAGTVDLRGCCVGVWVPLLFSFLLWQPGCCSDIFIYIHIYLCSAQAGDLPFYSSAQVIRRSNKILPSHRSYWNMKQWENDPRMAPFTWPLVSRLWWGFMSLSFFFFITFQFQEQHEPLSQFWETLLFHLFCQEKCRWASGLVWIAKTSWTSCTTAAMFKFKLQRSQKMIVPVGGTRFDALFLFVSQNSYKNCGSVQKCKCSLQCDTD